MSLSPEVFSSMLLHWCQNNESDLFLTKQVDYYSFKNKTKTQSEAL